MEKMQAVLEFLVITVGAKMIIGHWIAEHVTKWLKLWFSTSDRKQAIWEHYQARAMGKGHINDNVVSCGQEKCAVFNLV